MLPAEKTFRIGEFEFSRVRGLWQGDRPVKLRHIERQLLKCLLHRPGEIVRKEEIVATLWPYTQVSANTLNVHVRRLRITLNDSNRPHKLLKSVSRMGFMLIATPPPTQTGLRGTSLAQGDRSKFIRDVTVPDGSIVAPGESFEKVWEIQNVGSLAWRGRSLRRIGACTGPGRLICEPVTPIPMTEPGQLCLIRLRLNAPREPGSYYAAWKMVDAQDNECFHERGPLFVSIDVVE